MIYLYRNWPAIGIGIAIYIILLSIVNFPTLQLPLFLVWLQLPIYQIHQVEEHWYPGGFKVFANKILFNSSHPNFPFNDRNVFWINILEVWLLFTIIAIVAQTVAIAWATLLPWFSIINGTTHIIAGIKKRSYNPGLITSIILLIPMGIYTLIVLNQIDVLNWLLNLYGIVTAILLHLLLFAYIFYYYKTGAAVDNS